MNLILSGTRYEFRHAHPTHSPRSALVSGTKVLPEHFRKPDGQDPVPQESGMTERLDIHFPPLSNPPQLTYVLRLIVYDDEDQPSEESNLAWFHFLAGTNSGNVLSQSGTFRL